MKCLDPILCYRHASGAQYRHFSLANRLFLLRYDDIFPCRTCTSCRKERARELAMRCVLHASLYKENCFLTLTYDEKKENYHNEFHYPDIQKFKKRLRRYAEYNLNQKIQIFNVHEYGKKGKKHWHLVVFNFTPPDLTLAPSSSRLPIYTSPLLHRLWPHGFHTIGSVTEASAMYQSQYSQKDITNGNTLTKKKAHSKHSGIGREYFLKHYSQILQLGYIPFDGKQYPVPRYFEKLAHKHFSHFYQPENFIDYENKKRLYTKFKPGVANQKIAELYIQFSNDKQNQLNEAKKELKNKVDHYLLTNIKPDFILSAENYLYDQQNKQPLKEF